MDVLINKIEKAKYDTIELDRLISEYMPFIKKTINAPGDLVIEYDDRLSLAMLTFMSCVRQYKVERGNFMTFAAICIRNRLIDESRKQKKHIGKIIPLLSEEDSATNEYAIDKASIDAYNLEREQKSLIDEIEALSGRLEVYGISFKELPGISPRREGARRQCIEASKIYSNHSDFADR